MVALYRSAAIPVTVPEWTLADPMLKARRMPKGNDFSTEAVDKGPAADCDDDSRPDSQATREPSVSAVKNAANNRVVKTM